MKNALFLLWMVLGLVAFGQNLVFKYAIPINISVDSCEQSEDGCCFGKHQLQSYHSKGDSIFVGVRAMIRCGYEPWHDSLVAYKKSDTVFIRDIPRQRFWENGEMLGLETCCECCHRLRFSIKNDFTNTPVVYIDGEQLFLEPVPVIEKRHVFSFLKKYQDHLNHTPDSNGYIGSYFLEKFEKEGLPWQFIQRPMLVKDEEEKAHQISPIGLFTYHKGDTIIESIDNMEHSLALKITVNNRIIETRFEHGYWFRSTPGKAGRIKSVDLSFLMVI